MNKNPSHRYIKYLLLSTIIFIAFFTFCGLSYTYFYLSHQDIKKESRMANIRFLPKSFRQVAIFLFARNVKEQQKIEGNPAVLCIFGDSQMFGFRLPQKKVFHNFLPKYLPGIKAYNFAIIDGHLQDTLNVMKIVKLAELRCDYAVFNLNPAHLKVDAKNSTYLNDVNATTLNQMYKQFAKTLTSVSNLLWFGDLYNLKKTDLFMSSELSISNQIGFAMKQQKNYYQNLDAKISFDKLENVIAAAKQISENILIFTSPIYYIDYNKPPYNYKWDPIPSQLKLLTFCSSHADIRCIDWSNIMDKSKFMDLIHMNTKGHHRLAKLVATEIRNMKTNSA